MQEAASDYQEGTIKSEMCGLQQKEKYRYAYKFNGDRMARQKVMMPVDELGDIDFKFMNRYIASKEMKKLRVLFS